MSMLSKDQIKQMIQHYITMDVTKKWTMKVQNWGQILSQFVIFFEDRVTDHI